MIQLADCVGSILPRTRDWRTHLAREWQAAVGTLADRMRLEQIKNDLLIVGVYDSHWIAELHYLTPHIIEQINNFLGACHVTQLRFILAVRRTNFKKQTIKPSTEQHAQIRMTPRHEQILSTIKDGQLHDALEKFFYASVR